jgi:glycosyltransferase involved in cell wall biosynthesis
MPGVRQLCNKWLVKLWPFRVAALTNFMMARPMAGAAARSKQDPHPNPLPEYQERGQEVSREPTVTVVVPARNESGNIANIFARVPEMGGGTELIFVEGHSSDDTFAAIERHAAMNPQRKTKIFRQTGKGKGDAVRLGYANATGDILMILDADLTVTPEDLPRFYDAIRAGRGEFINGVRLVYPMERHAMRLLNLAGNKFFSFTFSWLLGQPIKDTLCGTKVMWRADYEKLAANRAYFGDFDPFGDFDLLFGAAKMSLKMVDMPIRYRERTYGTTNIQRWRHGWLLLKMSAFAAGKIKFV